MDERAGKFINLFEWIFFSQVRIWSLQEWK